MAPEHSPLLPAEVARACTARQKRVRGMLQTLGVDSLLISYPVDIRYLTGFNGDDSVLIVDETSSIIVSDPRYDEYLDPWRQVDGVEIVMGVRHRLEASVKDLAAQRSYGRLGYQAERVTVSGFAALETALGGTTLVETTNVLVGLRQRKDDVEIAAIERALRFQEDALAAALPHLEIGMSERAFAARIEFEMKSRGAEGASFEPIIATGANSSVIHHTTGPTPIGPGVLLVDWGAQADSYCGDLTRTFGVGELSPEMRAVYDIVLEAQLAAIDACAPGRTCAEIDAVARDIITKAGHGDHFGHGLGHGLGLEVHETPYFNDLETDTLLEPGMVMTVEPGIYLPGIGGVRIEDDVLITESGHRVLSGMPKDPSQAVIEPGARVTSP